MRLFLKFSDIDPIEFPSTLDSVLRDNLENLFPDEEGRTLDLCTVFPDTTLKACQILKKLLEDGVEPREMIKKSHRSTLFPPIVENTRSDRFGSELTTCEAIADYLGSNGLTRIIWQCRGFLRSSAEPVRLSDEEIRARPPLSVDLFPQEPWKIDNRLLDPYEDWNIAYFFKAKSDLHLLPGSDGLGAMRPLYDGASAGQLTICPLQQLVHDRFQRLRTIFEPFWYDPAQPKRAGVVLAGGAALYLLQGGFVPCGDVDIFFIGAKEDVRELLSQIVMRNASSWESAFMRTPNTLTFTATQYFRWRIQLITRVYDSVEALLSSFDIDAAKVAITSLPDGATKVFVTHSACTALRTGVIPIDPYRKVDPMMQHLRYLKYALKGFAFGSPVAFSWENTGTLHGCAGMEDWKRQYVEALRKAAEETVNEYPHAEDSYDRRRLEQRLIFYEYYIENALGNTVEDRSPYLAQFPLRAMPLLGRVCNGMQQIARTSRFGDSCGPHYYTYSGLTETELAAMKLGSFDITKSVAAVPVETHRLKTFNKVYAGVEWLCNTLVSRTGEAVADFAALPPDATSSSPMHPEEFVTRVLTPRIDQWPIPPQYAIRASCDSPGYWDALVAKYGLSMALLKRPLDNGTYVHYVNNGLFTR